MAKKFVSGLRLVLAGVAHHKGRRTVFRNVPACLNMDGLLLDKRQYRRFLRIEARSAASSH